MAKSSREFQAWIDEREGRILKQYKSANQTDVRHKCFVSYHHADQEEVEQFLESFEAVFIPRVLGVSDEDDFINSTDTNYIMDKIRENYLTDSTITIVMNGKCAWSRRYIDWEIYSTLRNDQKNKLGGLLAINLPSLEGKVQKLPPRLSDNVSGSDYAKWYKYPTSKEGLKSMINTAFDARVNKAASVRNSRSRQLSNEACS